MAGVSDDFGAAVKFENQQGLMLAGRYLDAGGTEVAVLCHGYLSGKDDIFLPQLAATLASKEISSLRFDFAGNGDSEGVFDFCKHSQEVEDIRSAVVWCRARGKAVVGLVGHSKGGAEVILYSAKYDDIPRVVNISGRFHMDRGLEERFGKNVFERLKKGPINLRSGPAPGFKWQLTQQSIDERLATDMAEASQRIKKSKVLTVHGSDDEVINVADAREFDLRIANHEVRIVDGANHNYTQQLHADQLCAIVADFVEDYF